MFEWRQEPCQFRDITDKVSLPKVTRNQTNPLRLKRKHTRKNGHASGLNENGSIAIYHEYFVNWLVIPPFDNKQFCNSGCSGAEM